MRNVCTECKTAIDVNELFTCPLCRHAVGFGWLQNTHDLKKNAPEVYKKMGTYLKYFVNTAYFRPSVYKFYRDVLVIFKVATAVVLVLILVGFFNDFIRHST
ncbi:MAG: hypothetical protein AB7P49_00730 [Bdellovibrionales bacterium]